MEGKVNADSLEMLEKRDEMVQQVIQDKRDSREMLTGLIRSWDQRQVTREPEENEENTERKEMRAGPVLLATEDLKVISVHSAEVLGLN